MNKKFLFLICLILFIFTVSSVSATDANQTENVLSADAGTFSQLQDTINNAENGSTVNLDKNYVYNGGENIKIDKDITINGNGHMIDGNHATRIFNIEYAEVVLKNIVFANALSSDDGGAILTYTSNIEIDNCSFINNAAGDYGGAIYAEYTYLSIDNSLFLNNSADSGAAIYFISYGNDMLISNSLINNNNAKLSFRLDTFFEDGQRYTNGDVYLRKGGCLADHQISISVTRDFAFDTTYPNITFINVSYNDVKNESRTFKEDDTSYGIDNETVRFEVYKNNVLLINTTAVTKDGIAKLDYGALTPVNTYDLKAYYNDLSDSETLLVKKDPNFTMSVDNIVYGEDVVINFDISSEIEDYENAQGSVQIWDVRSYRIWDIPDYEEDFYFKDKTMTINFLNLGSFVAILDFKGDDTFYSKSIYQIFNITYYNTTAKQPVINVEPFEKYFGDDKKLSFNLTDENGTGIAGK